MASATTASTSAELGLVDAPPAPGVPRHGAAACRASSPVGRQGEASFDLRGRGARGRDHASVGLRKTDRHALALLGRLAVPR